MKKLPIGLVALALCAGTASAEEFSDAVAAAEALSAQPAPTIASLSAYENHWRSSTRSRFRHVLEAPPGRVRVTIHATTDSPGGETVAVYPQTSGGERGSPRLGFVIATRVGNSEEFFVTIPKAPAGETLGRLPIIVDVENASGREFSGHYSITMEPA